MSERFHFRNLAAATSVAVLAGLGALYVTRPPTALHSAESEQIAGREQPGERSPNPLSADEISYRIARDKIRAVDAPTFLPAYESASVPDRMPVIGVADGREARAYPVPILSRVEIVNDQIGGRAIAVTW